MKIRKSFLTNAVVTLTTAAVVNICSPQARSHFAESSPAGQVAEQGDSTTDNAKALPKDIARDDSTATWKATADWLVKKITPICHWQFNEIYTDGSGRLLNVDCDSITVKGKTIVFAGHILFVDRNGIPTANWTVSEEVPLKKIAEVTSQSGEIGVSTSATGIGPQLIVTSVIRDDGSNYRQPSFAAQFQFRDCNSELAERIEKAFRHLIHLAIEMPDPKPAGEPF